MVPYLLAQTQLNPQRLLNNLLPSTDRLLFDILLYLIFFLMLIVMFGQPDKQLVPTIIAGLSCALAVIAKLRVFNTTDLGALVINAGILVFPMIVAGITKAKKTQPLAIISGVLGGVYFFGFWFFLQRGT